jgi:hypothetical protein
MIRSKNLFTKKFFKALTKFSDLWFMFAQRRRLGIKREKCF